jgi:NADH-quinone oxidoreductase subunit H
MISYEISVSMMLIIFFFIFGSIHLIDVVNMQSYSTLAIAIFPIFIIFYICGLAEINRLPFDLPEAESELVSGYHTEYSGIAFIFFNIGEYSHVLFLALLISEFFLGG